MVKPQKLKVAELREHCKKLQIEIKGKSKSDLLEALKEIENSKIKAAIKAGQGLPLLKDKIEELAESYAVNLNKKISDRKEEMKSDDNSHYLIYRVFGISVEEGQLIDEYQNTGRFLYKYAGSFLEEAASLCLKFKNIEGGKSYVKNNQGQRPKTFEIDFLDQNNAIEIKWRDATTDGDHITKEHTRVKAIQSYGYTQVRVMFYYPQRDQAKKIQETLKTIYQGINGEYYAGDDAWNFIISYTTYDLKGILTEIADKRVPLYGNE